MEVVNERSKIAAATKMDVPFDLNDKICVFENKVDGEMVKISQLMDMPKDCII